MAQSAKKRSRANESTARHPAKYEAGVPGSIGKQGEIEEAPGNVYPASGPRPPGDAEVREMAAWGQGERGPAGYEDSGPSEIIPPKRFAESARQPGKSSKK